MHIARAFTPAKLRCFLAIWSLLRGAAALDDPIVVQACNGTWAMRAEWSGQVSAGVSQTLEPAITLPSGLAMSVVLGGHSDNGAAVLTFQCTGLGYAAKTLMTPSYGLVVERWAFPGGGSCDVLVHNPSPSPVNTFFALLAMNVSGLAVNRIGGSSSN